MDLYQHLEDELRKDYQLLNQLEDKRRCEDDPRQSLKWNTAIKEIKHRIRTREAELKSQTISNSFSKQSSTVIDKPGLSEELFPAGRKYISTSPNKAIEVFFSYAHKDEKMRDELEIHLSTLKRQGIITGWHDRKIGAGKEWKNDIDIHLNTARIILLLISSAFIDSDYCWDVELKRAMERHEAKEARVIPVILKPVDWQNTPFEKLQVLPKDGKPVSKWGNRDEAFENIAKGIRQAVEELTMNL